MLSSKSDEPEMNSLAAQLQMAKLKRSQKAQQQTQPVENSGSSTSSGGSANYGTIGMFYEILQFYSMFINKFSIKNSF
jgi:hypothetical protein